MKKMIPLLMISLLLLSACGKKGPVRPIDSPPPVPQPCDSCGNKE